MQSPWGKSRRMDKSAPWVGINVHPRPGRKSRLEKGPDLPPAGGSDGLEHKFVRCKQCGFIANTFVNQQGSGWGNEMATSNLAVPQQLRDVDSGAGCPLCGSSEYV
jgi:hypothetical protein